MYSSALATPFVACRCCANSIVRPGCSFRRLPGCANFEIKIPVPRSALAATISCKPHSLSHDQLFDARMEKSEANFVLVQKYKRCSNQTMWTSQTESESSLPRATDKAEERSKNGLRSDLRASNLKNFSWDRRIPLAAACFSTQSCTYSA